MTHAKIVHVITRLDLGGAQQNTLYTVSHLDREIFEPVLITGLGGLLDQEIKTSEGFPKSYSLSSLAREISPLRDLLAFLELTRILADEKPQVVHTHSSKAGVLGRLAAVLAGVPVIIHTYHGFGFNDFQPAWIKSLYVWVERLCCFFTDRIIFVSQSNWNYAQRHRLGRTQRYRLIRSGISLSNFPASISDRASKKAELGFGRHKPLIISIGNLKPQKNPYDFLAMAQKVLGVNPEVEFLFIGDGELRPQIEGKIFALGLGHRISFPGWRRDTAELLAVSDVFVLTSRWEGLPRSLIEAMKTGLPAVCYAVDGITDVIENGVNGFAVPIGDVAGLAQHVLELLKNPDLHRRLGQKGAQTIGKEFDISLMVEQQQELYLICMNDSKLVQ